MDSVRSGGKSIWELMRRPGADINELVEQAGDAANELKTLASENPQAIKTVAIDAAYSGYLAKQDQAKRTPAGPRRQEDTSRGWTITKSPNFAGKPRKNSRKFNPPISARRCALAESPHPIFPSSRYISPPEIRKIRNLLQKHQNIKAVDIYRFISPKLTVTL